MTTSYNGFTASKSPSAIGILTGFTAAGVTFPAGVRSGAVAAVFTYLAEQFNARVEPLVNPGCWGYYFKNSANSAALISCHSSGTAVDFNAPKHPNGRRGTFTNAQVAQIRAILDELGGVVYWGGGGWNGGTVDEMHFEIKTGVSEAQVRAVADRLGTTGPATEEDELNQEQADQLAAIYAAVQVPGQPFGYPAANSNKLDALAKQVAEAVGMLKGPTQWDQLTRVLSYLPAIYAAAIAGDSSPLSDKAVADLAAKLKDGLGDAVAKSLGERLAK